MPLRLQADEDSQAMAVRLVEEPAWRRSISPHGVEAVRGHCGEVLLDDLGRRKRFAICIGLEGSIGHAANVKLFLANAQKFASHRNNVAIRGRVASRHVYRQGLRRTRWHPR